MPGQHPIPAVPNPPGGKRPAGRWLILLSVWAIGLMIWLLYLVVLGYVLLVIL